ncbi:hypothetical protein TSAR_013916 [Trichomalopsis sarcophagae]|uniref:Uncharacterized protein n=1 Tax=Trichomalopsis sarcophagae TaxID=543379 RepID=A0A232FKV8_9HYME|nr:hypothetical protein TSAR_013916 [Trichomalopsis sarcophagae]
MSESMSVLDSETESGDLAAPGLVPEASAVSLRATLTLPRGRMKIMFLSRALPRTMQRYPLAPAPAPQYIALEHPMETKKS